VVLFHAFFALFVLGYSHGFFVAHVIRELLLIDELDRYTYEYLKIQNPMV